MRAYYAHRHKGEAPSLTFDELLAAVEGRFRHFYPMGYLQKAFGYDCVDDTGGEFGEVGYALPEHFRRVTGLEMGSGPWRFLARASEPELFTLLEFIYDYIAKPDPSTGMRHTVAPDGQCPDGVCGWHFSPGKAQFDVDAGRREWREALNPCLKHYGDGYELTPEGEVRKLSPEGFEELLSRPAPEDAPRTNAEKLDIAVRTFRLAKSSREERKAAVRQLADILEWYRHQVVKVHMTDDEKELFETVNKFGVRHNNQVQKDDYREDFLEYLFYRYLAAVQLCMKLAHEEPAPEGTPS
jgi:hypothetical protein